MTEHDIFAAAIKLTGEQRSAFLTAACGEDTALRQQVEALLQAHEESGGLLPRLTDRDLEATCLHHGRPQPGTIIAGRYKLLEAIGEGGMGTVWMAEQREPVKRKVAIKLVKAGMDSRQVLARFEAERQALALMDHPNIAKVFDGGMTDQGRPYFAMEFVKGVPLTDYCNQARLSLKDRLNLFIPVCQAVQHAHQKGIIHRDLKPSNILICLYDGKPVPKVIDFGLAKAMHHSLTEQTLHTAFGLMVGTPLYMSPEQAEHNNLDVDTRSDIYSLGVILYELLTGTTPLEKQQLHAAAFNEILRLIKEVEPPKPSTRLSGSASLPSIAAQRSIDPKQLSKSLTGDLDWIVMKALDKERSRRYETANGLARDVERFLHDEAVEASPPSTSYRLRKLMRKHRAALSTLAGFAALLVIGTGLSTWLAIRATKAESVARQSLVAEAAQRQRAEKNQQKADEQRAKAEALAHAEAVQRAKAEHARDRTRQALDAMTSTVTGDSLATQTEITEDQKKFLTEVLTYYQEFAGEQPDDETSRARTAAAAYRVGEIESRLGRREQGVAAFEMARSAYAALHTDFPAEPEYRHQLARSHKSLALVLQELGKLSLAEEQFRTALAVGEELAIDFPTAPQYRLNLANSHNHLGQLLWGLFKRSEAEKQHQKAVAIGEQLVAEFPNDPEYRRELARSHTSLGSLQRVLFGKQAEAEEHARKALAIWEKLVAEFPTAREHRHLFGMNEYTLGEVLLVRRKEVEAEKHMRRAVAIREKLAADFPTIPQYRQYLATSCDRLGDQWRQQGKLSEAGELFHRALAIREKLAAEFPTMPRYRQQLAASHCSLRDLLRGLGKQAEADEHSQEAMSIREKLTTDFPTSKDYQRDLGNSYYDRAFDYEYRRRHAEAAADWKKFLEISRSFDPAWANFHYGAAQLKLGKLDEAEAGFNRALALREQAAESAGSDAKEPHWLAAICLWDCGYAYFQAQRPEQAENWLGRAIRKLTAFEQQWPGADVTQSLLWAHRHRADALGQLNRNSEALQEWDRVIELSPKPEQPGVRAIRATSRARAGQVTEALADVAELTRSTDWNPGQWYNFARVYSIASHKIADKQRDYADRAMELLQQAVETGFKDDALIAKDTDLNPLRDHDDFRNLVIDLVRKQIDESRTSFSQDERALSIALARHGLTLLKLKEWTDAEPVLRESLAFREKNHPDAWNTFEVRSRLGGSLLGQKKYAEAEPLLLASYEGLKQCESTIPASEKCLPDCLERLIELYTAWEKPEKAGEWRQKRDQPGVSPVPQSTERVDSPVKSSP